MMDIEDIRESYEMNKWKDCCKAALEMAAGRIDNFRDYRAFRDGGFVCPTCGVHWMEDLHAQVKEGGYPYRPTEQPTWEMIALLLAELPRKNYVFVLERDGEVIDQTGLNEDDVSVAEDLFFGEFDHGPRQEGDKVYLVEVEDED